ncbi:hypothetical protein KF7HA_02592 [Lactococcus lactis]|nr:hypothetical protein [Lactococcus lactis]
MTLLGLQRFLGQQFQEYLNGKYENMSEETRQRIEKVITELDYRPSRQAQFLNHRIPLLLVLPLVTFQIFTLHYLSKGF